MIDDFTLSARWGLAEGLDEWHLEGDRVHTDAPHRYNLGRRVEREWLHGPGIDLSFVPETMHSWIHINPQKLRGGLNFPLIDFASPEELDLGPASSFVLKAFGHDVPEEKAVRAAGLLSRGVVRIAYTVDVFVGADQKVPMLLALAGIKRRRQARAQTWCNRQGQINTVQFGDDRVRVQFYDKADQLVGKVLARRERRGRIADTDREAAIAAEGFLRFEVTLRGLAAVRQVFGSSLSADVAPRLRLMGRREVANYILVRELEKLRLTKLVSPPATRRARFGIAVATQAVLEAVRRYNELPGSAREKGGSRVRFNAVYARALAHAHATQDLITPAHLRAWGLRSTATDRRLVQDLSALGLPILRPHERRQDGMLHAFMEALRRARPDLFDTRLPVLSSPLPKEWFLPADSVRELPGRSLVQGRPRHDEAPAR